MEYILEHHDWLQGKCAICWLVYDEIQTEHVTRSCQLLEQELGEPYSQFRAKNISYRSNVSCYGCGRPGDLCEKYKSQGECRGKDVVLPSIVMGYIKLDLGYWDIIRTLADREFVDVKDFCNQMTERRRFLRYNGMNAWAVWGEILKNKGSEA